MTAGLQPVRPSNLLLPQAIRVHHHRGDPEDVDDEQAGKDVGEAVRGR